MKISNRLEQIAKLVRGNRVADIGTDHAYLPIYLCQQGLATEVLACDVRRGPLEKAKENIKAHGFENRIHTYLSNGFHKITEQAVDTAVVAGMGGLLMIDILKAEQTFVQGLQELILSPHEDVGEVRKFVYEMGFCIEAEMMLKEKGHFYTILRCIPNIQKETYEQDIFYEYGKLLLERQEPILKEFLEQEESKQRRLLERLQQSQQKKGILEPIEQKIQEIEEGLKWFVK